jgi:hypothetical protein
MKRISAKPGCVGVTDGAIDLRIAAQIESDDTRVHVTMEEPRVWRGPPTNSDALACISRKVGTEIDVVSPNGTIFMPYSGPWSIPIHLGR